MIVFFLSIIMKLGANLPSLVDPICPLDCWFCKMMQYPCWLVCLHTVCRYAWYNLIFLLQDGSSHFRTCVSVINSKMRLVWMFLLSSHRANLDDCIALRWHNRNNVLVCVGTEETMIVVRTSEIDKILMWLSLVLTELLSFLSVIKSTSQHCYNVMMWVELCE